MKAHRLIITLGSLIAALIWISRTSLLVEMTRVGEITPLAFLLLAIAVVTLLAGGVRVYLGYSGRLSFALHLAFVGVAGVLMDFVMRVPLVVSAFVAAVALVWSFSARQALQADRHEESAPR
jgi:hypothetical protein